MKQPKLIKKLREIPPNERQEFLILEYCQSEYELRVIEGKNVIDEVLKATIEFRNTLHNRYEDFQPLRDFSKFKTMPLREYFNAIKNQLDERNSSEYELKRKLEIDYLKRQLEAEKERSKALEEKIEVLEHNKGLSDLNKQLKDNNIRLNNSLLHILYEFPIKDIIKWRKSI